MKRPLCLLAILLTAAVFIYLELCLSDITGSIPSEGDGREAVLTGQVQGKEFRKSFSGDILPVIYLFPKSQNDQDISDLYLIQCYLDSCDSLPAIGQFVELSGRVKIFSPPTNPGEFDSRLYYSTLKISYRLTGCSILRQGGNPDRYKETLFRVRTFLENALDMSLSEEDSAIMKAMLLGDKAFMDSDLKDMYKDNGIIHILAVSGLHISIIGMGLYELLKRLGLRIAGSVDRLLGGSWLEKPFFWNLAPAIIAIAFMYSYGIMCGMGTSSFRAICMFTLRLMAPLAGRTYDVLSALALAEILLLLDQPLYLYNSGFLFSFGAVVGITVIKPILSPARILAGEEDMKMKFVDGKDRSGLSVNLVGEKVNFPMVFDAFGHTFDFMALALGLLDGLKSCLAITAVTLPVYACFYYTFPLHSMVLNLLVIPLMGVLMMSGIVCMLLSAGLMTLFPCAFSLPLLPKMPGALVHLILAFYRWLCSGRTIRSGFTWYMGHSHKWQVLLYMMLVGGFMLLSGGLKNQEFAKKVRKYGHNFRYMDIFRALILAMAVLVLTFRADPDLEIDMIDVGQGDGIVISCEGKHMLIDGGSTSKKNVGKYRIIPFLKYKGIGTLDAVVMTHEDEDHISGILEVMEDMEKGGIRVMQLILPEVSQSSRGENYRKIEAMATDIGIPIAYINTGEEFSLGGALFTCLNPSLNMVSEGANAYSTVLLMRFGQFTALFTGDMEGQGLENVKKELKAGKGSSMKLTLLKVAHHGSQYTTDAQFLELTNPSIAIISCGLNNSYGHPHKELLERLDAIGTRVYRTDESGEICIKKDAHGVSVSLYKKQG